MTYRDPDLDPDTDRYSDRVEADAPTREHVQAPAEREVVEREVVHEHVAPAERPVVAAAPAVIERGPSPGDLIRRVVTLAFGILQALLIIRIILLLLIANTGNEVVAFVLTVTDPFVEPFRGMFQLDRVADQSGIVLDVAAIVALIGWTLVEVLVLAVLSLGSRRRDVVA
jgi:uncharacterized protein YggT (Ycf19 family)